MRSAFHLLGLASGLASVANAHTAFTTLFVNGENQGDGICVRMPEDASTATYPIANVNGDDMVCGRNGLNPNKFTCPVPQSSSLTFWWRAWPDFAQTGSIDPSHMGPCAVYLKQVPSAASASGSGPGWFKIWGEGYDDTAKQWCTHKLIENQGFLTVDLPSGIPGGDYLVRAEILALHASFEEDDPQFYVECAQISVQDGPVTELNIPQGLDVAIPGHVTKGSPPLKWDVWNWDPTEYESPGPAIFRPSSSSSSSSVMMSASGVDVTDDDGNDCLVTNGDWCGIEVPSYSNSESGCWAASEDCWSQSSKCYDTAKPTGYRNCNVWDAKCEGIQNACDSGQFTGPPNEGVKLEREDAAVPKGVSFAAWDSTSEDVVSESRAPEVENEAPEGSVDEPAEEPAIEPGYEAPKATEHPTPVGDVEEEEEEGQAEEEEEDTVSSPASELNISVDGRCGGSTGQTCEGSEFGGCCSRRGQCGDTKKHCGCRCNSAFGRCN